MYPTRCLAPHLRHLRGRLIITYTLLIVLGFGLLSWFAGGQISRAAQEDFTAAHQAQTELLARSLGEDVEKTLDGEEPLADLHARLVSYDTQLQGPLVLFDSEGRVLLDSRGVETVGEQWETPEVIAALARNPSHMIRSNQEGIATVFAAAPVMDEEKLLGVIQAARPMSAAATAVRQRWGALAIGVSLLGLLSIIASSLLATSLTRPLEAMRRAALRLAAGDLDQQLPIEREDEIGQVAKAFNYMVAQVRTMVDEQRAFAANASHELRTPLTTIRLRSEALRAQPLDSPQARQYIAEIDDEATRLSGLVEDLILLARLDAGRAVRGRDEIDVARLARSLARELEQLPETTGITLSVSAPPDLPVLTASLNHLRVLLRNLLSNAITYTPPGGRVACALQAQAGELTITVTDNGQGIAADDLPHVTERFFRADKAHTRAVKGSGLGLALVHSIVQCYDGRLAISSPGLGHGTTVRVWLPIQQTTLPNPNRPQR